MADVKLKSLKFPGLPNRYVIPTDAEDFTFENENLADVLQKKANIDGFYDELTAGSAEQLISSQFVEDSEPYKFRTTGGSADVGNREQVDAIVGGTIAWNQICNTTRASATVNGLTLSASGTAETGFTVTITGTSTREDNYTLGGSTLFVKDHVYIAFAGTPNANGVRPNINGLASPLGMDGVMWKKGNEDIGLNILIENATAVNLTLHPQWFDLTQMFGSAVADHIYAMEQGNAGAGVKWFKSLFPNDYYAYNAGELVSVGGLQSHDTVGFNAWDEVWEVGNLNASTGANGSGANIRSKNYIPVLPSTDYFINSLELNIPCLYDVNKVYLGQASCTRMSNGWIIHTSEQAHYFRFSMSNNYGTTYKGDICINLSWSGWRNGEYEPYQKHSYPLDSSLTLRGVPKLSADNKMYYDGDEYLSDGSVTRKYKIVTYNGSENWDAETGSTYSGQNFYVAKPSDALPYAEGLEYAQKFLTPMAVSSNVLTDNILTPSSGYFNFAIGARLGITTVADFKTYLASHPISVLYPIAEPTTETAEPYTKVQTCDDFGTEEYVSTSIVPVGHNTEYPANLRDKIQHLPDLADNDGYYVIKQASKKMSLEPFRIPKAPSENGTYVLKATVSGGTPTYTWVEEN